MKKPAPKRIGILASYGAVHLGYYIRDLLAREVTVTAILFDDMTETPRELEIHQERTQGRMPALPLSQFSSNAPPCYFVGHHNGPEILDLIDRLDIDLLVNAGTPRILKGPLLNATPWGVLNCHPGLMPNFRGCTCVEWALYEDAPVGVTVHRMTEGIDEGPVLAQQIVPVYIGDSYADLRTRVYFASTSAMAAAVNALQKGLLDASHFIPQEQGTYRKVIDSEKLTVSMAKLENGTYAHCSQRINL